MADKRTLIRRLSLTGYVILVFLVFLFILFPFDRVKSRLEGEVGRTTQLELSIAHISPRFLNRFVLSDVVLSDRQGRVLFETPALHATVSLVSLLRGGLSAGLKAAAYGGKVVVKVQRAPGRESLTLNADGLDLSSYTLLRNTGIKLSGTIGGSFEMNNNAGKGRLWVKDVTLRELKVKGFPVPDLDFEKGWMEADLKGDRLTIRKLELDGKECSRSGQRETWCCANGGL